MKDSAPRYGQSTNRVERLLAPPDSGWARTVVRGSRSTGQVPSRPPTDANLYPHTAWHEQQLALVPPTIYAQRFVRFMVQSGTMHLVVGIVSGWGFIFAWSLVEAFINPLLLPLGFFLMCGGVGWFDRQLLRLHDEGGTGRDFWRVMGQTALYYALIIALLRIVP